MSEEKQKPGPLDALALEKKKNWVHWRFHRIATKLGTFLIAACMTPRGTTSPNISKVKCKYCIERHEREEKRHG